MLEDRVLGAGIAESDVAQLEAPALGHLGDGHLGRRDRTERREHRLDPLG